MPNLFHKEAKLLDGKTSRFKTPNNVTAMLDPLMHFVAMTELMEKNVRKISRLITALKKNAAIKNSPMILIGVSMGGATLLKALHQVKGIDLAVIRISGLLDYRFDSAFSKVRLFQPFFDYVQKAFDLKGKIKKWQAHLLIQNGVDDPFVTLPLSRKMDRHLSKKYPRKGRRYRYLEYQKTGHEVTSAMDRDAMKWISGIFPKFSQINSPHPFPSTVSQ